LRHFREERRWCKNVFAARLRAIFTPQSPPSDTEGFPSKQNTSGLPPQKEANMEQISYFRAGDYLLPAIKLSDPPDAPPLGLYGELHKRYLREHRPILYSKLLLSEKLYPLCREIDEAARSRRKLGMGHSEIVRELVYK